MSKLRFIMVLLLVFGFAAAGHAQSRRGDVNGDGAFDMSDIIYAIELLQMPDVPFEAVDFNFDGRANVFDLLELLLQMRWLGGSEDESMRATVAINGNEMAEPYVFVFQPVERWGGYSGSPYYGPFTGDYSVYANRPIDRAELVLDGDTLLDISGYTPTLAVKDSTGQGDSVVQMLGDEFVVSEPKQWQLKVWDTTGEMFVDSGQTRFAIVYDFSIEGGASANVGLPLKIPLVLHGPWQRFALVHPNFTDSDLPLCIDLNPAGVDSVVFDNIDQLIELLMEQIAAALPTWRASPEGIFDFGGPYATAAVSKHSEGKSDRLLFYLHRIGGISINLEPLDGNERLLEALGFPRWRREARYGIYNFNYMKDPQIYEKYKSQIE